MKRRISSLSRTLLGGVVCVVAGGFTVACGDPEQVDPGAARIEGNDAGGAHADDDGPALDDDGARPDDDSPDETWRLAGELIDRLTLDMNRARQSEITQEILEVVAGADALTQ